MCHSAGNVCERVDTPGGRDQGAPEIASSVFQRLLVARPIVRAIQENKSQFTGGFVVDNVNLRNEYFVAQSRLHKPQSRSKQMQNEINELRNQVRSLKRMLFVVFGGVIAGGLLAATGLQTVPDVITAKKFEVVDAAGKVVISLSSNKEGGLLHINDEQGQHVVAIESLGTGGTLHLKDSKLKLQTTLTADTTYGSALMLWADCTESWPVPGTPVATVSIATKEGASSMTLLSSADALKSSTMLFGPDAEDKSFFGFEAINKNGDVVTRAGLDNGTTGVLKTIKPKQP